MSQAVREAIKSKLAADGTLAGLANGVFSDIAPSPEDTPYVIFAKRDGRYEHAFRDPSLNGQLYLVKGVSQKKAEAEAIDARCRQLLHRGTLNITGHELKSILIVSDVEYAETPDNERYDHVGAVYRIVTE